MKTNDILKELDKIIQSLIEHTDNQPGTLFCKNVDKLINLQADLANNDLRKKQFTLESWMIANRKKGWVFYSKKPDKTLTAIASGYGVKIKTERLVVVSTINKDPKAEKLTRVTIL